MCDRIPYKTIVTCKLGDEDALKTILKHYEPLIVEASKKKIVDGNGMVTYVVDEDVKAYIISELTMAIMKKYDPTRVPRKKKDVWNYIKFLARIQETDISHYIFSLSALRSLS